jgi:signal transduction histidine kinase/ActR/RegA family two-component response regulator
MLLLCVVLDRFGAALAEAYAIALGRQHEAERVSQQLRVAKESLESEMERRRRAEALLFQSQKLEAIGRLSGGVAHDFNNLLTAILGFTHISHDALSPEDPAREHLEGVLQAAQRGAGLTRQLLAFARKQIVEPRAIRMEDRVRAVEPMLRRLIGENVHIALVLAAEPQPVLIDPVQFDQVLMNLAVNARDAMPTGGRLTIETANVELDEAYAVTHVAMNAGPYVMIAVSDTGEGMDAATRARVFEPFFTTKEQGKGSGLGLATVYGMVKQSAGYIWVYSEPGHGTVFKVYLPPTPASSIAPRITDGDDTAAGWETVLLVEDEDAVRVLAREVLRRHGYVVLEAHHGLDALDVAERHPDEIHLLLTDVVMPYMSGRALVDRLAAARPTTKALFMSGYTDHALMNEDLPAGAAFLQKPFTPEVLARRVRHVLDTEQVERLR